MIIFSGTKNYRDEHFLCFSNEAGSSIDIPVSKQVSVWFLRYLDRLSPGTKPVEAPLSEDSE
jgi:hypothetical protein